MTKALNFSNESKFFVEKLRSLGLRSVESFDDVSNLQHNLTYYLNKSVNSERLKITSKIDKLNQKEANIKDSIVQHKNNRVFKFFLRFKLKNAKNNRRKLEQSLEVLPSSIEKKFKLGQKFIKDNFNKYLGTIGEEIVSKELVKLPDNYFVFNNFFAKLKNPLINRKEHWHLRWIQIDHVVVGPAGIFTIETKNWSKETINKQEYWGFEQIDMFSEAFSLCIRKRLGVKQKAFKLLVFTKDYLKDFEPSYYPDVVELHYKKLNQYVLDKEYEKRRLSNSIIKKIVLFLIQKNNKRI